MPQPASQAAAFLAQQPGFNLRCQLMALQFAVNVVLSEDPATANHASRLSFGLKVLSGQVSPVTLAQVVLTDTAIQAVAVGDAGNSGAAVPDTGAGSIDGRLQAMWNALSNALG